MFANKIAHTNSPGGQRRGLIYVSSDIEQGTPINSGVYISSVAREVKLEFTDGGDVSMCFWVEPLIFIRSPATAQSVFLNGDWYPLFVYDTTLSIKINGTTFTVSDLPIISDNDIKTEIQTLTFTGLDDSVIQKDFYVCYINVSGMNIIEEGDDQWYYDTGSVDGTHYSYPINKKAKMYAHKKNILYFNKQIKMYNTDLTGDIGLDNTKMKEEYGLTTRCCTEANTISINADHKVKFEFTYDDDFTIDIKSENEISSNQSFTFNQKREIESDLYAYYGIKNIFFGYNPVMRVIDLKVRPDYTISLEFYTDGSYTDNSSILSQASDLRVQHYNIVGEGYLPFKSMSSSEFIISPRNAYVPPIIFTPYNFGTFFEATVGDDPSYTVTGLDMKSYYTN